jgi:hypothetical protein
MRLISSIVYITCLKIKSLKSLDRKTRLSIIRNANNRGLLCVDDIRSINISKQTTIGHVDDVEAEVDVDDDDVCVNASFALARV